MTKNSKGYVMPRTGVHADERYEASRSTTDRIIDLGVSILRIERQAAAIVLGIVADALHDTVASGHERVAKVRETRHRTRSREHGSLDRALGRVIDTVDDVADRLTQRADEVVAGADEAPLSGGAGADKKT